MPAERICNLRSDTDLWGLSSLHDVSAVGYNGILAHLISETHNLKFREILKLKRMPPFSHELLVSGIKSFSRIASALVNIILNTWPPVSNSTPAPSGL